MINLAFILVMLASGCLQERTVVNEDYLEVDEKDVVVTDPPKSLSIDEKIRDRLVGHELVYYNIAGMPQSYTITGEDIGTIEQTTLNGEAAWRVKIGEEGLAWEIYLDKDGEEILKEVQLFVS